MAGMGGETRTKWWGRNGCARRWLVRVWLPCLPCALTGACGSNAPPHPAYVIEDAHLSAADAGPDVSDVTQSSIAGFGAACEQGGSPCPSGLFCMSTPNGKSYCSQLCASTDKGKACPGVPVGMTAPCIAKLPDGKLACAFACAAPGFTFPCPPDLQCEPTENPPGQKLCLPK